MFLDDALTHLVHTATYGLSDQFLSKGVISADRIMIETTGGKPVVVSDVSNDPRIQYPQETMKEGIFSELSVPLYLRDRITGVLRIYSGKRQEFSADVIKLLSAIADLSAIAIENARMHESLKKAHDVCLTELGYWQP